MKKYMESETDEKRNGVRGVGRVGDGDDEEEDNKWVNDSSMDYKGKRPLRASTGAWKAALFILTIELSERVSYFGIATNLITYLTKVIQQDLKTAAKNVNMWSGVTTVIPLLGGFLADAYTGRYLMILISSFIYLMGLGLLTMSQYIPSLKPCGGGAKRCSNPRKIHEVVFFLAMYCVSLGTGGQKPCLESFGADQFDDDHPQERRKKMSYFNWWNFSLCCGLLLGVTLIAYVVDSVSWGFAGVILTATLAVSILIFCSGRRLYRYRAADGSGFTPMLQVFVAAIAKRRLNYPSSSSLLYEVSQSQNPRRLLNQTNNLRFLDKAAIIEGDDDDKEKKSPWRLATVTQVEEAKLVLNMIPIWLTSLTFGVTVAQSSTFFLKQSSTLDRRLSHGFEIPAASIHTLTAFGMIVSVAVYDKILVPALRRVTGSERGISILQRIGIGLMLAVANMVIGAMVERKRLDFSHKLGGGNHGHLPMTVLWLAPQYIILGVADAFTAVGLQEYFYDQVPDSMRSLGIAFYISVFGVGNFLSSFVITTVDHVTSKSGTSWFGKDLNNSRLDNFYWLLAVVNGLNLSVYLLLARRYSYKNVQRNDSTVVNCSADGHTKVESMA